MTDLEQLVNEFIEREGDSHVLSQQHNSCDDSLYSSGIEDGICIGANQLKPLLLEALGALDAIVDVNYDQDDKFRMINISQKTLTNIKGRLNG